jgi:hypothetical protein
VENNILNDCSVIIQGKVFGEPADAYNKQITLHCIESVRRVMPNAEIILSTWEGTDVSHLSFDKVVFCKDPGAIPYNDLNPNYLNNINRQIVSTYNGFKAATRTYAIKMRGDCQLIDSSFVNFLMPYARSSKFKFFKERILIPTKYSRNPRRIAQLLHASDIFQVGLLEDLLSLWSINLQPEPYFTRAIPANKIIINDALQGPNFRMKFGPEQYIWYAFAKKKGHDFELKHYSSLPLSKIMNSEWSIMNNFVIAEAEDIGLLLPKRIQDHKVKDLYTHKEWQSLYKRYCITGVSEFYEFKMLLQVYSNNALKIVVRILNSLNYKTKTLFKKMVPAQPVNIQDTTGN